MKYCAVIKDKNIDRIKKNISNFELCEVRLDLTGDKDKFLKEIFALPQEMIAVYRPTGIDQGIIIATLKKAILYGAKYIELDIETSEDILIDMIQFANQSKVKVILAYYNMTYTENYPKLQEICDKMKQFKTDYIKVVTTIINAVDIKNILKLNADYEDIIAIGMGEKGKITRLVAIMMESPIIYVHAGSVNNRSSVGQLKIQQIKNIMKIMHN